MSEKTPEATRSAQVTAFFGDRKHDFRLGIGEIEELQELTGVGLIRNLERITDIFVTDLRETLRLGLIGGGATKEQAWTLVNRHLRPGYLVDAANVAGRIIQAALRGAPEDTPGEPDGEGTTKPPSPKAE